MLNPTVPLVVPQGYTAIQRMCLLDCWISVLKIKDALSVTQALIRQRKGGYVCFANVHTLVTSQMHPRLREITNQAALVLADGKPLSVIARWRGVRKMGRVTGPDFFPLLLGSAPGLRHYFYGSTSEVLEDLCACLRAKFPEAHIAGAYSPPFRPLEPAERMDVIERINAAKPDVIWVGLGAPKQEYWMADHWQSLRPAVLLGVGGAFKMHAGHQLRAPAWVGALGVEWMYRLFQEPRRLWKRYLVTNTLFLYYLARECISGAKRCASQG